MIVKYANMCIKADMKSYIPLETAAIFFPANLFLKQGIISEYVMVNFICMDLLNLFGTRTKNYKMKNSCPQWDISIIILHVSIFTEFLIHQFSNFIIYPLKDK